jgi:hypothetical protein
MRLELPEETEVVMDLVNPYRHPWEMAAAVQTSAARSPNEGPFSPAHARHVPSGVAFLDSVVATSAAYPSSSTALPSRADALRFPVL